jgi:hypothetical protein
MLKGCDMNHQPFEDWLFSEDPLPADDERELRDHLMDCDQCSELENAWMGVASLFNEVPNVAPAPGFANRWQATLEADRVADKAMRQRWQSLIFLVVIANGAAVALMLMGVQLFNTYGSVTEWVMSWVYKAATAMVLVNGFGNAFITISRTVPQLIPNEWWIAIVVTLGFSTIVWFVSMTKLSSLQRRAS